jgi:hypothetical protein
VLSYRTGNSGNGHVPLQMSCISEQAHVCAPTQICIAIVLPRLGDIHYRIMSLRVKLINKSSLVD